jgi:hypothetical protein
VEQRDLPGVGFYDPAFRQLWFTPRKRFGIQPAIVAVLAGNWRPSPLTRVRIEMFFALVALRRLARGSGVQAVRDTAR